MYALLCSHKSNAHIHFVCYIEYIIKMRYFVYLCMYVSISKREFRKRKSKVNTDRHTYFVWKNHSDHNIYSLLMFLCKEC